MGKIAEKKKDSALVYIQGFFQQTPGQKLGIKWST